MLKKIILMLLLLSIALLFDACSYRESCGYYGPYNTCGYNSCGCGSCSPYRPIW